MHGLHVAVVDNLKPEELSRVQAYLPDNYSASQVGSVIVVEGRDFAGWTYKDYVEPRLATGMIHLREVTPRLDARRESFTDRLSGYHEDLQEIMDTLDEMRKEVDPSYGWTKSALTETQEHLGWAQIALRAAIDSWREEYDQHIEAIERGYR